MGRFDFLKYIVALGMFLFFSYAAMRSDYRLRHNEEMTVKIAADLVIHNAQLADELKKHDARLAEDLRKHNEELASNLRKANKEIAGDLLKYKMDGEASRKDTKARQDTIIKNQEEMLRLLRGKPQKVSLDTIIRVGEAVQELDAHMHPLSDAHRRDNVPTALRLLRPILKLELE